MMESGVGRGVPWEAQQPQKKGKGCFFYGCLGSIVILIIAAIAIYFSAKSFISTAVEKYTISTPIELPSSGATQSDYEAVARRVGDFINALKDGTGPQTLSLSSKDLNSLIDYDHEWKELKGLLYVDMQGSDFRAKANVPLDKYGWKGRYVTGDAVLDIGVQDSTLIVTLKALTVNGMQVPDTIMAELRKTNLAEDFNKDSSKLGLFKKIRRMTIQNGQLMLES